MANYWTRRNDSSKELDTIAPWQESEMNGDKNIPLPHYHVVCGIIRYGDTFLCMQKGKTRFPYTSHHWEFPGGKVEEGETPEDALLRELREEMAYTVRVVHRVGSVMHTYPDFAITLEAFLCDADSQEFTRREHADHRWLTLSAMPSLTWCAADAPLIGMLHDLLSE